MAKYVPPISQSTVQVVPQVQPVIYQSVVPVQPLYQSYVSFPTYSYVKQQPQVQTVQVPATQQQQQYQSVGSTQPSVAYQASESQIKAPLRGSSRIEYIPYQRKVIDYEQQVQTQIVPKERYVTDYYAVEHTTNYIPQTYYDSYVDYVPVTRYKERTEYYPVESSRTVINRL
ncbi:hypothetical protein ABPG72_014743 [Tetrahymena utriculariae]